MLLAFSSCRSFRQLSSRDNTENIAVNKRTNSNKKNTFIDNIEVTPGSTVTNKHKTSSTNTTNTQNQSANKTRSEIISNNFTVENSNYLQLKYAVLIGVTIDRLNNIALLQEIDKWWGTRYCWGGTTEECLDCSAFTQIVLRDVYGVNLPRTAQEQYNAGEKMETPDLKEGDLVFFHTTGRKKRAITHVGVYLQNNKFAHAATSGGVMISDLNEKYWEPKFRGGARLK
ncbi:MAG: C40 family peptidase [Sediminibacterium sp.]